MSNKATTKSETPIPGDTKSTTDTTSPAAGASPPVAPQISPGTLAAVVGTGSTEQKKLFAQRRIIHGDRIIAKGGEIPHGKDQDAVPPSSVALLLKNGDIAETAPQPSETKSTEGKTA